MELVEAKEWTLMAEEAGTAGQVEEVELAKALELIEKRAYLVEVEEVEERAKL